MTILTKIFLILIPLQLYFNIYKSYTISWVELIAIFFIVFSFFKYRKKTSHNLEKWIISFVGIMFLTSITAYNPVTAFIYSCKWTVLVLLFFYFSNWVDSIKKFENLAIVLILPAFLLSLTGLAQYIFFTGQEMMDLLFKHRDLVAKIIEPSSLALRFKLDGFNWNMVGDIRAFGTFLNTNNYAAYIGLLLPIIIGLFINSQNLIKKIILGSAGGLLLVNELITFSRGGWLGLGISSIVVSVLILKKQPFKIIVRWLAAVVFLLLLLFTIGPLRRNIINKIKGIGGAFQERSEIWSGAFEIISDNPAVGTGPANYSYAMVNKNFRGPSHSNYLQIAAEFGIVGLFIFLNILMLLLKISLELFKSSNMKLRNYGVVFIMIWVWFLAQSFFSTSIFGEKYGMMFWAVAGLNLSLYKLNKKEEIKS